MSSRRNPGRRAVFGAGALLVGLSFIAHFAGCGFSTEGTHPDVAGTPCTAAPDCDDKDPCTDDACTNQLCTNTSQVDGTACNAGAGNGVCTSGKCAVKCTSNAGCDDKNACTTDSCDLGSMTCVYGLLSGPEPGVVPIKGDCTQAVCDAGVAKIVNDDSDVPESADCKAATCADGKLTISDLPANAACGTGGKLKCDGSGVCANCVNAGDCVVTNACELAACTGGRCIPTNVTSGTAPPSLATAGDCRKVVCDGMGKSTSQEDDSDIPADDGNTCTVEECVAGGPVHDASTMVNQGCATGVCDPTGKCVQCNNASQCNDGDPCSTDSCVQGVCVHPAASCNDGDPCTADSCVAFKGCVHAPSSGAACDDKNLCTTGDVCTNGTCGGTAKNCADTNVCTNDACNPVDGTCTHTNNTASCDDGNACTTGDTCSGGGCTGIPTDCDDSNPCTADSCSAISGACQHDTASLDGSVCGPAASCSTNKKNFTPASICSVGICVVGTPQSCNDGNPCTNDLCSPDTGCSHVSTPGAVCAVASCSISGTQSQPASTCDNSPTSQCTAPAPVPCGGLYQCNGAGTCETCSDNTLNGNETDVDCGGGSPCSPCGPGQICNGDGDCASGTCFHQGGGGGQQGVCGGP